jgi:dihydrofolate reductase
MRKVIAGLFMSLDGVVESPASWAFPRYLDAELTQIIRAGLPQADAVLMGRRTYEDFARLWPSQPRTVPMASFLNDSPKYVVSSLLRGPLEWANSILLPGTLAGELVRLKALPGANIQIPGSPTLVRSLLREGLLDKLAVSICPVVVGVGARLFDETIRDVSLRVAESRVLRTGVLNVVYEPQRGKRSDPPIEFARAGAAHLVSRPRGA